VDLLRALPSTVLVSSTLGNPRLGPDKLVDGDLATAWNSRTGDLVGGWIAFRVGGSYTEVLDVALTAGFTKQGREDLFTENPRIARVRVYVGPRALGEADLDVQSRTLQSLPFVGRGGFWRIEVVRVVPGTRASWRELSITELRVRGRSPDAIEGSHVPDVQVGLLPTIDAGPPPVDDTGPATAAPGPPASAAEVAHARRAVLAARTAIETAEQALVRAGDRGPRPTHRLEAEVSSAENGVQLAKGDLAIAVCGASEENRVRWARVRAASAGAFEALVRAATAYDADPNDPSDYEAGEHDQAKGRAESTVEPVVEALDAILDACPVDDPDLAPE
jgi:hypothetical protein